MSTGTTLDLPETQLFIGGEWTPSGTGATLPVINPATGEAITHVSDASVQDGLAALDAACAVQDTWAAKPARDRPTSSLAPTGASSTAGTSSPD